MKKIIAAVLALVLLSASGGALAGAMYDPQTVVLNLNDARETFWEWSIDSSVTLSPEGNNTFSGSIDIRFTKSSIVINDNTRVSIIPEVSEGALTLNGQTVGSWSCTMAGSCSIQASQMTYDDSNSACTAAISAQLNPEYKSVKLEGTATGTVTFICKEENI